MRLWVRLRLFMLIYGILVNFEWKVVFIEDNISRDKGSMVVQIIQDKTLCGILVTKKYTFSCPMVKFGSMSL